MAQKKAHEVDGWIARPDPRITIILLYGPDRGLVSERAKSLAEKSGLPLDDPFSTVRMDGSQSDGEAGDRLLTEARMVPMFSPRRLLWMRNAGNAKPLADAVAELAASPPPDALLLIEAGDLKKGAPLRACVEASPHAMALPCYADEERALDGLIAAETQRSGITLSPEAKTFLRSHLGGDRLASRGELEKLALYVGGRGEITLDDVRALVGDVSAVSADDMIDHVLSGNGTGFSGLFARHVRNAGEVQALLSGALRQFQSLYLLRGRMEASRQSAGTVVAGMRPPPFFSRKPILEKALGRWTAEGFQWILSQLQDTVLEARRRPDLALAVTERALLRIASSGDARPAG